MKHKIFAKVSEDQGIEPVKDFYDLIDKKYFSPPT